jgi:hypothetical protein
LNDEGLCCSGSGSNNMQPDSLLDLTELTLNFMQSGIDTTELFVDVPISDRSLTPRRHARPSDAKIYSLKRRG